MMGDNLSPDDGVALLGNTLATWGTGPPKGASMALQLVFLAIT